jgi:hypothetical protein
MTKALSIVGSSRNNGEREKDDFYPTPKYAVEELLKREVFYGNIWECACGEGDISEVLKEKGYNVYSSDLIDRGYGDGGIDFLEQEQLFSNIITNPPYKNALEFVLASKRQSTNKIAMFLKTVFLESEKRKEMFNDKDYGLKTMYQFSKRLTLSQKKNNIKKGGMIAYAWYVWEKGYCGKPTIEWI